MRVSNKAIRIGVLTLGTGAALALGGCDLSKDADEQPSPTPAPAATAAIAGTPAPAEGEPPVASIIREDALPGPIVELPPEPLSVVVPFGDGGSDPAPGAERILADILKSDAMKQDWPIVLRGHTDSAGNDKANLNASRSRAEAVAAWLVDHGVDDERIEVIAMGEQNPLAPNARPDGEPNEPGRAKNRRVEVAIAPPPSSQGDATVEPDQPGSGSTGTKEGGKSTDKPA